MIGYLVNFQRRGQSHWKPELKRELDLDPVDCPQFETVGLVTDDHRLVQLFVFANSGTEALELGRAEFKRLFPNRWFISV